MNVPKEVEQLKDDLIWVRHYSTQYKTLFLHNQTRIDLLNEVAPRFFRDIQKMYWDQMIIGVSKLMDPHEQKGNRNLSLMILPKLAKENQWGIDTELNEIINKAREKAKPVVQRRMKLTAHRDLPTALGTIVLDTVHIAEIDESLELAGEALNLVFFTLNQPTWAWDLVSSHNADELIAYIKLAIIYRDITEHEKDWKKDFELKRASRFYNA